MNSIVFLLIALQARMAGHFRWMGPLVMRLVVGYAFMLTGWAKLNQPKFGGNIMKLNSKSGAAIAAAAGTVFLAGSTMSTAVYAAGEGKMHWRERLQGPERLQGRSVAAKGANACKGQGFAAMTKDKCEPAKGKFVAG